MWSNKAEIYNLMGQIEKKKEEKKIKDKPDNETDKKST